MKTELSIVMPCLNEAQTLERCIGDALEFVRHNGISAEILVVDNGSDDGSPEIARRSGATVVECAARGYGNALKAGFAAAQGQFIIMGDCDMSYDFRHLETFVDALRGGAHLVVGNRFANIERGAMPPLHRYFGVPLLSFMGRCLFGANIRDFHCGLRGFVNPKLLNFQFKSDGMEMATEIIVEFTRRGYITRNVPSALRVDGRNRPSHLRTFRDGMRHVRYMIGTFFGRNYCK